MSRAVSSALGVLLVTALTLVLAAVAGVAVIATVSPATVSSADVPERVALSASANATTGQVDLVHEAGPALDVREIRVRISVGGTRLKHQPPVPFYSASGFGSFPSGPFNPVADPRWEPGEWAGLVITGGNAAPLVSGASVRIELYRGEYPIAAVETRAR